VSRLSGLASRFLATAPQSTRHKLHALRFRRLTDDLRGLVELCDDATRKLGGQWVLDRRYVASFGQRALELGREIVFDSGVLAGGDSSELYADLDSVRGGLDGLLARPALGDSREPFVVPLGYAEGAGAVWGPLGRLAELQQHLEIVIPEGFAITVAGLVEHLKHNGLWERVQRACERRASDSGDEVEAPGLVEALRAAPLPETIRRAIADATAALVEVEPEATFALYPTPASSEQSGRSGEWAHAVHGLSPADVAGAYARLASELVPLHVVREGEGWPCVTCVRETPTERRGVLLTSDPDRPLSMRLEVGAGGETHVVPRHPARGELDGLPEDLAPLARMALVVERFAGRPQMIGWTRNEAGFVVVHCSDLDPPATEPPSGPRLAEALRRHESVFRDPASVAVAGFAVGPVRRVSGRPRLPDTARPAVLVLDDVSGDLPRDLLRKAAAVLAAPDVAEESWLALAREWCVPVLGGLGAATERLEEAEAVTVDADDGVVYRGLVEDLVLHHLVEPSSYQAEPEYRLLREAIRRVAPPSDAEAAPEPQGASPLAEVLRGAHERALASFGALHFGSWGRREGKTLRGAGFPGSVRVVDAGGGVSPPGEDDWRSGLAWQRVRSEPLRALLEPLTPADLEQSTRPRGSGPAALAVLAEERAVVHIQWPTGTLLIDAGLGEHVTANTIYCALRGTPVGDAGPLREAIVEAGFHLLDLGAGLTGWRPARELDDTRRVLGRMGQALGTLLSEPGRDSRGGDDR
jgi:phosphohistidine swiveling domain-containing protein